MKCKGAPVGSFLVFPYPELVRCPECGQTFAPIVDTPDRVASVARLPEHETPQEPRHD